MNFGDGRHVVGRKNHRCSACWASIPKGERHYHQTGMYGGDWQNWRMHEECFDAYAEDGYEEFVGGEFPVPEAVKQRLQQGPAHAPAGAGASPPEGLARGEETEGGRP